MRISFGSSISKRALAVVLALGAGGGVIPITPPVLPIPSLPYEPAYQAFTQPTDNTVFYPWPDQTLKQYMNANLQTGVQKSTNFKNFFKFGVYDDDAGWSGDQYNAANHQRSEFGGYSEFGREIWESFGSRVHFGGGFKPSDQSYLVIKQLQHVPDNTASYGPPPCSMILKDDGLYLNVTSYPTYENPIAHWTSVPYGPFPYAIDAPHNMLWNVKNGPTGDGTVQLWIDGVQVFSRVGNIAVGYPDSAANNLFSKEGVYLSHIVPGSGKSCTHEVWNLETSTSPLTARILNPLPLVGLGLGPSTASVGYGQSTTIPITGLAAGETVTSFPGGAISSDGKSVVVSPMASYAPTLKTSLNNTLTISITTALPVHQLLADFEDTTGVAVSSSAATFALDNTRRLTGSASIGYVGKSNGDMGVFTKTNVFNGDPSTLGAVMFAVYNDPQDPGLLGTLIPRLRNGSTTSSAPQSNATPKPGWFFVSKHVSDYSPALSVVGQYDFVVAFNAAGAPANQKINIDTVAANVNGIPSILLQCDDTLIGQTGALKDDLNAASTAAGLTTPLRATLYVAPKNIAKGPGNSQLSAIRACRDAGWGISLDGTEDDTQMVAAVDLETAINGPVDNRFNPAVPGSGGVSLNAGRQFLRDNDLLDGKGGENHFCYPNGSTAAAQPSSAVAAATSDGASPSTLTFAAAPTRAVVVGDTYYGAGPRGLTVASLNGTDGKSVTLTGVVPAGTYKVLFRDESGPFQFGELAERAQTEGFLSGRISAGEPQGFPSRYGVGDQAMYLNAISIAGFTFDAIKSYIDGAMKLGNAVILLIHGYDNGAYLNVDRTVFQQVLAYAAPLVAAGKLTWPTQAEWFTRDCANPAPLPGRVTAIVKPAKPVVTTTPGANKVTVAWTDGAAGSSPITGHNIFRGNGTTAPKLIGNVTNGNSYVDTTAVNGTQYIYQVAAVSLEGQGIRSNPISVTPVADQTIAVLPTMSAQPVMIHSFAKAATASSTYNGPLFQLVRASDSATMDIAALGSGLPDYAAIDTWIGSSSAAVSIVYDQSGNARHLTQTTAVNRPQFNSQVSENGIRGAALSFWPERNNQRYFNMPALAGLDRTAMGIHQTVSYRSLAQKDSFFSFQNAGATADVLAISCDIGLKTYDGSTVQNAYAYPAQGVGTLAYVGTVANEFLWHDGTKVTQTARAAGAIASGGRVGSSISIGQNGHNLFSNIVFASAPSDADITALNTWSGQVFGSISASPTRGVDWCGNSITSGWGESLSLNPPYQAGMAANYRVHNTGIGGITLQSTYAQRGNVDGKVAKIANVPYVGTVCDISNDLQNLTFTSVADAQAWADAISGPTGTPGTYSGGTVQPYAQMQIDYLKSAGYVGVVVQGVLNRTAWDETSNFRTSAVKRYNANMAALAASKGFTFADNMGDARLADPTNQTYYYTDGTHLNNAGGAVRGGIEKAAILAEFTRVGASGA